MGKSGLGDHSMKDGEDLVQEPQAGQCLTKKGEFLGKTEYSNLFLDFSPFFSFPLFQLLWERNSIWSCRWHYC